ncbi:hypothetical protein FACS1894219_03230 [Clostridia bacterium]|nr:hypothetical protein FACS1894219_03230 [Clostridia bacterium]
MIPQLPRPLKITPLDDYKLDITFKNNERRIFDVTPYLSKKYFAPLRSRGLFSTARANGHTVEWLNGIDICPDELYSKSVPVGEE